MLLTRVLILFFIRREGREERAVLWRGTQESYVGEIRMSKAVILSAWMLKPRGQGASAWMGGLDPMCTPGKAPPLRLRLLPALVPQYPLAGTWQQQGLESPEKPRGLEAFGSSPPMDSWHRHIERSGADLINLALSVGPKLVFRTVCVRWVVRLHEEVFCPQVNLGTIG